MLAMLLLSAPIANAAASPTNPSRPPATSSPGRIAATHLDPYSVFNASTATLDTMFSTQRAAGITTVIVQWTGVYLSSGNVVTTYPASPATGFGAFDAVLPRILDSARRNGITVWLGLVLKDSVFDEPDTRTDTALMNSIALADGVIAQDLLSKYAGQFAGWYIPTEPGYQTVSDTNLLALHTQHVSQITTALDALSPQLPIMISPSTPRAIEGGMSGVEFVQRLKPMITGTGVDVWNLQDGYKMTSWTPAQNKALVEEGQRIAFPLGKTVWVTLYTPGPGDSNYPLTPQLLFNDIDAVGSTGAKVTIWTYNSSMNPDPNRPNAAARKALRDAYVARLSS